MNWKQEAIDHLQKYDAMVKAIDTIPSELTRLETISKNMGGIRTDLTKVKTSPSPNHDQMLNNFVQKQELERSYENARLWVCATDKAMSILSAEEKLILQRMYVRPEKGVVADLCETLGVEQSTVYRKRDNALCRFTLALYGAA